MGATAPAAANPTTPSANGCRTPQRKAAAAASAPAQATANSGARSPFARRKPRSFAEQKATVVSAVAARPHRSSGTIAIAANKNSPQGIRALL